MSNLFTFLAAAGYLLTTLTIALRLRRGERASTISLRHSAPWLVALLLHSLALGLSLFTPSGLNLNLDVAMSLTAWFISTLLFASACRQPIESIALIILPLVALALLTGFAFPHLKAQLVTGAPGLKWHVLGSMLAFSLFALAAAQAIVLAWQDRQLRSHQLKGWIRVLPPLQHMEDFLFQLLSLGFILLTVALLTGWLFLEDIFAQHLVHKTALSMIAWVIFAGLLAGRLRFGWRGKKAIKWTLWGFALLAVSYFGSKLVLEIILQA